MGRQGELNLYRGRHGGRRPKCGRKEIHSRGVRHRPRERVGRRTPAHVNFKLNARIRNKACLKILKRAILNARRQGLGVVHYSLQSNHVHLIVEAGDNKTLTRGMRSMTVTFAKGLKRGRVQLERYHLHVLRGPQETRNAVHYVVNNHERHAGTPGRDPFSSLVAAPGSLDHAISWLLSHGTS